MNKLLDSFKLSSPIFPNNNMSLTFVRRNDTAQFALEHLIAKGLSALPIVDAERNNEPLGLFSVQHVVTYVVKQFNTHHTGEPREQDFLKFLSADLQFKAWNCYDFVMYCSTHFQTPPALAMPSNLSLRDACRLLVDRRATEVIVFDPDNANRLVNVIAANRIVEFLTAGLDELPASYKPIGDFEHSLAISKGPIVAVLHDATVMSAFEQMIDKRANACAVLDDEREICGNISLADIKTLGAGFERLRLLEVDCDAFLKAIRSDPARPGHGKHHHHEHREHDDQQKQLKKHQHGRRHHSSHRHSRPLVVCCLSDPLRDCFALFSYYRVSHVFVVPEDSDDDKKGLMPIGEFDTLDALAWLLHEAKDKFVDEKAEVKAAKSETLADLKQPIDIKG